MKVSFPLLVFVCMSTLVGCNRESIDLQAIADEVDALKSKCVTLERVATDLRTQLRLVSEKQEELSTRLSQGNLAKAETVAGMDEIGKAFESYRATYRDFIRKQAKGMSFPFLEVEGRRFVNVVVRDLTDSEMSFQHRDGMSRVECDKLSEDVKDFFVLDGNMSYTASPPAQEFRLVEVPMIMDLGIESAKPVLAPLAPTGVSVGNARGSSCPPCMMAAPRLPLGYKPVGSSFQGSYYNGRKSTIGFQGTR
jgi:hypothetical protein